MVNSESRYQRSGNQNLTAMEEMHYIQVQHEQYLKRLELQVDPYISD